MPFRRVLKTIFRGRAERRRTAKIRLVERNRLERAPFSPAFEQKARAFVQKNYPGLSEPLTEEIEEVHADHHLDLPEKLKAVITILTQAGLEKRSSEEAAHIQEYLGLTKKELSEWTQQTLNPRRKKI